MNYDEMKQQLVSDGDYTKAEVEAMSVDEVINAWLSLPPFFI